MPGSSSIQGFTRDMSSRALNPFVSCRVKRAPVGRIFVERPHILLDLAGFLVEHRCHGVVTRIPGVFGEFAQQALRSLERAQRRPEGAFGAAGDQPSRQNDHVRGDGDAADGAGKNVRGAILMMDENGAA